MINFTRTFLLYKAITSITRYDITSCCIRKNLDTTFVTTDFFIKMFPKIHKNMKVISKQIPDSETKRYITLINIHFTSTTTTGGFKGGAGGHAPLPPRRCQR